MARNGYRVKTRRGYRVSWERMQAVRRSKHITQAALAAAVGVAPMTLWRIEHGRSDPSFGVVLALARELGLPLEKLIEIHEI